MAMIRWMVVVLVALGFVVPASAQTITPDHGGFVLKRPLRFSLLPAPLDGATKPARIYAVELTPSPAEPAAIGIAVQRKRNRMVALPARRIGTVPLPTDLSGDAQPRSSLMLVDAHGSVPLADGLQAELGWQGAKLNNRGANVTALYGRDAIKSRDLFLPMGRLAYDAAPGVTLRADYRETIEAYAGVGLSGALGLTREAFRTLQAGLRPERDSRMRLGSDWMVASDLTLAVDAFDGEIEDRLAFVEDGYLPVNRGSACAGAGDAGGASADVRAQPVGALPYGATAPGPGRQCAGTAADAGGALGEGTMALPGCRGAEQCAGADAG